MLEGFCSVSGKRCTLFLFSRKKRIGPSCPTRRCAGAWCTADQSAQTERQRGSISFRSTALIGCHVHNVTQATPETCHVLQQIEQPTLASPPTVNNGGELRICGTRCSINHVAPTWPHSRLVPHCVLPSCTLGSMPLPEGHAGSHVKTSHQGRPRQVVPTTLRKSRYLKSQLLGFGGDVTSKWAPEEHTNKQPIPQSHRNGGKCIHSDPYYRTCDFASTMKFDRIPQPIQHGLQNSPLTTGGSCF